MASRPKPIFIHRLQIKIRQDQRDHLDQIALVLNLNVSEIVRWILDCGLDSFDNQLSLQKESQA